LTGWAKKICWKMDGMPLAALLPSDLGEQNPGFVKIRNVGWPMLVMGHLIASVDGWRFEQYAGPLLGFFF